ncbi:hypothetical protein [Yoonia sp.]|uniref:hypothetical protein n=1 Tax=Yoonia sp. TaxID=2212373 RepID=UPI003F6BD436
MLAPHMAQFCKAQDTILDQTEAFTRSWFDRRHEAMQTAHEAVRAVNGNGGDHSPVARTLMDWQQHSVQRLTRDMQKWLALCSRCASGAGSAEPKAGVKGVKEVAKRAESTARTNHATPV